MRAAKAAVAASSLVYLAILGAVSATAGGAHMVKASNERAAAFAAAGTYSSEGPGANR